MPARSEPIWHPLPSPTFPCLYARQEFVISGKVAQAWLRCAGNRPFAVYLNGALLGRGAGPTLTAAPVWESFAIAPLLLQPGDNLILVLAGAAGFAAPPWFRAEGEITYEDGPRVHLGTGRLWQVQPAEALQLYREKPLSIAYFAAQEPANWTAGHFRAADWETAIPVDGPEPLIWDPHPAVEVETWATGLAAFGEVDSGGPLRFVEQPAAMATCKCVRREALLHSGKQQALIQTRAPERAVYLVLDFGHPRTGFLRLRLRGPQGGVVDLGFARHWGQLDSGLRYLSGEGRQEWTSHHLETGRYLVVRLSNWPAEAEIDSLSLVERRSQVPARSAFRAAAPLPRFWEIGQRTVEACRQEIYHLSPGPGPYDWLKAQLFALNDFYLTGDTRTAAAMLASSHPPRPSAAGIRQSLAYPLFAAAYYQYSGDRDFIQRLLPGILQLLADCAVAADQDPLASTTALQALYAGALKAAARLCRALREGPQRQTCEQAYRQVRQELQAAWRADQGLFADQNRVGEPGAAGESSFSQWTNALILHFDLASDEQLPRILEQLQAATPIRSGDLLEAFFLAAGLWQANADQQALAVVERQWGPLLDREGPTWSDKVAPPAPAPGPEFFLGAQILGVKPLAPGYRILEIRPHLSGLDSAAGQLFTARGPLTVEWRRDAAQSRFILRAELRAAGETHLVVPRLDLRFPTLTLNGATVWRNEKIYPNPFVRELISEDQHIGLVLHQAGNYEVQVE